MTDTNNQLEQLWNDLHRDVRRFIRRRVGDDTTTDDLLQQTFVGVIKGLPGLRREEHVTGWVYQIARNTITDHYRSKARDRVEVDGRELEPIAQDASGDSTMNAEVGRWLLGLIESLPESYRQAMRLVEVEGLTQREAAERLGLSWSGAKSRVQRGRAMLKQALAQCCELGFDRRGNVLACEAKASRGGGSCGCDAAKPDPRAR